MTFPGMFDDIPRNIWQHSLECLATFPAPRHASPPPQKKYAQYSLKNEHFANTSTKLPKKGNCITPRSVYSTQKLEPAPNTALGTDIDTRRRKNSSSHSASR